MFEMGPLLVFSALALVIDTSFGDRCSYSATSYVTRRTSCGFFLLCKACCSTDSSWGRCTVTTPHSVTRYRCCDGWSGNGCNNPICTTGCSNGGTCSRPNQCECRTGYTGKYCQTPNCRPACQNGGECLGPNNCKCRYGFNGRQCEKAICAKCENGGICIRPNTCSCRSGYAGQHCDISICTPDCMNGGTCSSPNHCICSSGFTGRSCETAICDPKCENGGECTRPNHCECRTGFKGQHCQTPICVPECKGGGECVRPGTCACPPWYAGNRCQTSVCRPKCKNGGICNKNHYCECPSGYTGRSCETPICEPYCENGGECTSPNNCKCQPGYEGQNCQTPICDSECQNGGTCIRPNTCSCPQGSAGSLCQRSICRPDCENGGICSRPYHCDCPSGFTGKSCETPVCTPECQNGGSCVRPHQCECPSAFEGQSCNIKICSHLSPCYPGKCTYPNTCSCYSGFTDSDSGCLKFSSEHTRSRPVITGCEITLSRIRRKDKKRLFYFKMPCSESTTKDTVWSNQALFNHVNFKISSYFVIHNLPLEPAYVSESGFGLVEGAMHVTHSKLPRYGRNRLISFEQTYQCRDVSDKRPKERINCDKTEENYKINIEHDDSFTVTYYSRSGGYRELIDIDNHHHYKTELYVGRNVSKVIEFKFDFLAPTHCSEPSAPTICKNGERPIDFGDDIRKAPLRIRWDGWDDSLSGVAHYYLEIFKLEPNVHGELTELEPLKPIYSFTTNKTSSFDFPTFHPPQTGMYSILLQASDKANNSKIARRLCLYDNDSSITLTKPGFSSDQPLNVTDMSIGDGGMHVISAVPETGYMWQTAKEGGKTKIVLDWTNHFVNKRHKDGKLLNKVLNYPTQFANLQDDGILRSKKYVNLTDNEGQRTRSKIPNINGIVKFEINTVFTDEKDIPTTGWKRNDLSERYEMEENLIDGTHLRLWVRATDILSHTRSDYTELHIDDSPPRLAKGTLHKNVINGTYTYTSRITFEASDDESGVHWIEYSLFVGNSMSVHVSGGITANRNNETGACRKDPKCRCVLQTCFLVDQSLDIDNCWFLVPKEELNKPARIHVKVFNQARLYQELVLNISRLSELQGLEEYFGPTNIRTEESHSSGVRLAWDLPKEASCYGRADIDVILLNTDGTTRVVTISNEGTSVDLLGLEPDTDYSVSLRLGYRDTELATLKHTIKTAPQQNYLSGGAIGGISAAVLVLIGAFIVILVVLWRRGHMQPVRKGLSTMSVKYRSTVAGLRSRANSYGHRTRNTNTESLYMYGEMDFRDIQNWQMDRNMIVLESKLKSGTFADIYLATKRSCNTTVVAKILKEDHKEQDELLMKAKINFNATEVGQHDNVLQFIGAVVEGSDIGPFIIYEYCPNGQLRDYLETVRNQETVETVERLFRFGLGVARGMNYLAEKKIVHRRLAARNILLDSDLEPKISGFGPQPVERSEDGGKGKQRERIPLKWMAPECHKSTVDATEKSDVWSFGIVLWEIFSLGESPYENIRGRELPARLKGGYRLPKPELCDEKWYSAMKKAWSEDPKERPTFSEIINDLDEMFVAAPGDDYYYCNRN